MFNPTAKFIHVYLKLTSQGQVAQSVEQRTENPCVGGSIPPLATNQYQLMKETKLISDAAISYVGGIVM